MLLEKTAMECIGITIQPIYLKGYCYGGGVNFIHVKFQAKRDISQSAKGF